MLWVTNAAPPTQIGALGDRIGGSDAAQAADGLAVVLILIQRHLVIGGLDAGRDHQFLESGAIRIRQTAGRTA